MKLMNFIEDGEIRLGIKTERGIVDVARAAAGRSMDMPVDMMSVIRQGNTALEKLAGLENETGELVQEADLVFAPCVPAPEKILCVGLNYLEHITEANENVPQFPILFGKFNNALAAHKQKIVLPKSAVEFDHEAEFVIVIGREASCIGKDEALSYVFGYTAGNDFSARDLQFRTGQWLIGKSCDGFAPIGPYLVTADEVNPNNLNIRCEVNGELRQSGNTSEMLFDCASVISYASHYMTLKPGDIIFTGTPSGVTIGAPEDRRVWLKPGDEMIVTIEGIGSLTNTLG